jgi:Cysteine rich repeat
MRRLTLLLVCFTPAFAQPALADQASALAALRAACGDDAQKFCAGVQPGGGRIIECLKAHKSELSDRCKQAAAQAAGQSGNTGTGNASPAPAAQPSGAMDSSSAAPPGPASAAAKQPAASPPATAHVHGATAAKDEPSGAYLRMKQVQIMDHGMSKDQAVPAFDLLIPSAWNFKGGVVFGGSKSGCFSDLYAVSWDATNPGGSVAFQGAPDYSWQYADDPAVLKKLTDPNRRQLGAGATPCPVTKPMKAEEYLREYVLKALPSGNTVVSVQPFPELNQIVRKRVGLPPGEGNVNGSVQTDAVRMRTEFQKDGQAQEAWLAVGVVTHIYRQGRGGFYDCHAISLVALRAPKGKLDANDKLFKVMISAVRPEPKWQAASNGVIAKLYNAEAQKEAMQDKMIADFQRHVAETINGVTANASQGAMNSAYGADQNIRGVQTFRDPSTGNTMELSNLYDHAWLNGSNEYIMSDDPNFNPNGQLSGNWNQLQAVRPAP